MAKLPWHGTRVADFTVVLAGGSGVRQAVHEGSEVTAGYRLGGPASDGKSH